MSLSIMSLVVLGGVFGSIVGALAPSKRIGCSLLLAVPVGMVIYVSIWQSQNPEALRSTSPLEFFFGPLWPSLGAVVGWQFGKSVRSIFSDGT
ncbi:hypothetical protein [Qipengyuania vesicularis]|uniref:hypothetical protein n=1 Tax=Qipengyuania vesicularis TaxID=2867232 RepID=UPI001C86F1FB|nr:hypothetical protein [Qipengyuania vesicularis]MBX7526940.1 hypothetical protein [Qipengyuania vesicularis]